MQGIDHGLCFAAQFKLRTVIWDLGAAAIADVWRTDLERLATAHGVGLPGLYPGAPAAAPGPAAAAAGAGSPGRPPRCRGRAASRRR